MEKYLYLITSFIQNYPLIIYLILFLGSFFSVLFPVGIFFLGEIFFLGGAILAGLGFLDIKITFFFLLLGGFLGDIISYYLGKYFCYKNTISKDIDIELLRFKIFFKNNKFLKLIDDTWGFSIFLARMTPPISWGVSFIAGYKKYNYFKFIFFILTSSYISITFFIVLGYTFGIFYSNILSVFYNYLYFILFVLVYTYISYFYLLKYLKIHRHFNFKILKNKILKKYNKIYGEQIKKYKYYKLYLLHIFRFKNLRGTLIHSIIFFGISIFIYVIFMYIVFVKNANIDNSFYYFKEKITDFTQLTSDKLDTYFIKENKNIQPINIIIVTNDDISKIFDKIGWQENKIILKDKIGFIEYYNLFKQKTLPVTNMTLYGKSQDFAYQQPGINNKNRVHIRGWNYGTYEGKKVYLLSISQDLEYDFDWFNNFFTLIHEIDKNIDISRDLFLESIKNLDFIKNINYIYSSKLINENNYLTDGKIYIINY